MLAFAALFAACSKEDVKIASLQLDEASNTITQKTTAVGVNVTPAVGVVGPNSLAAITLSGGGYLYYGGTIRARLVSLSGANQIVVEISKQDGSVFTKAGVAKLVMGNVYPSANCPIVASVPYSVGQLTARLTATVYLSQGVSHYYPIVESSSGGTRYYAEPFLAYTIPMYKSGSLCNGRYFRDFEQCCSKSK